jgi:glucosamine--fructose-6-phosphate aminotransferase (isomerizing)
MCGIIGVLGRDAAAPRLVEALKRLEYRGYDSAGIAVLENGHIERRRAEGKIRNLEELLAKKPAPGLEGIGHTRWATHGRPSERNAHPHATKRVAIVHNGIIENFRALRQELTDLGHVFESETDSEVIAHLITHNLDQGLSPDDAVKVSLTKLEGAFAIACLFAGEHDLLIGARKGSPLVVGVGDGEAFLGSDAIALAPFTERLIYLEEGDRAVLTRDSATIYDEAGNRANRPVRIVHGASAAIEKGGYRHFMLKEIAEQPETTSRTIANAIDGLNERAILPEIPGFDFAKLDRIVISACGTAYYAGCVAKYWLERYAGVPVEIDVASEFRYREPPMPKNGLAIFVSQSGETADTLAALRYCKAQGLSTIAVVNVPTSTIAREADVIWPTLAGPEIGVASTKAFTAQLATLAAAAIAIGRARGKISAEEERVMCRALMEAPRLLAETIKATEEPIQKLAHELAKARDVLYLGRGQNFPLALEGALKLKEISYIHAEGYAAGELKHGPIALIDEDTPVIFIAPKDALYEKTISNLQEVAARGGRVVLISDKEGIAHAGDVWAAIETPVSHPIAAPIVLAVPMQLLAYYVAVQKGTDVDQPRNLAKSVTVE